MDNFRSILSSAEITSMQQNSGEFLFISGVKELIPFISIQGWCDFDESRWFFDVHFRSEPLVPAVIQIESMVQISSLMVLAKPEYSGRIMYLGSISEARFYTKIQPNDRLDVKSRMVKVIDTSYIIESRGYVKERLACKTRFIMTLSKSGTV